MITNQVISDKNYVIDQRNALRRPIFDTYILAANTATPTKIVMFDAPMSSTKGAEKTNITRPYQLSPGQRLTMFSLRIVPVAVDEADLVALIKQYTVNFLLNRVALLNAPVDYWAAGAGLAGVAATTAATTTIKQFTNGNPDPRAVIDFGDKPIVIDDSDTFSIEILGTTFTTAAAGTGLFLRAYLDGVLEGIVAGQ